MSNRRPVVACLALAVLACGGGSSPAAPTQPTPPPAKWIALGSWEWQPHLTPAAEVQLCPLTVRVSPQPDSAVSENVRVTDLRTPVDGTVGVEYLGNARGEMSGNSLHLLIAGLSTDANDTSSYHATFDGTLDTLSLPHSLSGRLIESDINGTDTSAYVFVERPVGC
ncbi:MAG TPA: hypothetical protein VF102_07135 [Gemmatimonadaceae bacterium]